jgi:catechol 2,3-dioxygenase-like lactoylglutathione lyase family enzyme
MAVKAIDHVQLAMPPGQEQEARRFYHHVLGIPEVSKPTDLASRGGCWFESGDLKIHLGVEQDFRAARKAHPGLIVEHMSELLTKLDAAGYPVTDEKIFDDCRHAYVSDPFGNRIELIERNTDM